jgi:uncharacterized protein YjiS (DUF1127 family)
MSSACTPAPRTDRSLAGKARAIWRTLLRRRKERRDARMLDRFDDHLPRDIGLSRGELAATVYRLAPETRSGERCQGRARHG